MPSLTRRNFLTVAGAVGATVLIARIEIGKYLISRSSKSSQTLETSMHSSSLIFASGYAPANQSGIQAFMFDETNGTLTLHGSFTGITNPSFIVIHPNQRWLYAVSETGINSDSKFGEVWAFRFEREPFSIEAINHQTTSGDWPCHLRIDATGKWIIATNYGTGNAAVYPILEDGSLGEMTDFVQHAGSGPNKERQEGPHAHSSIFTPDNRFAIIADLGIDQLVIYEFASSTGKLRLHASVNTTSGAGPRHLAVHPNGKWMYAANELNNTVTKYEYDAAKGTLLQRQSLLTIPSDSPENIVADSHISTNGERIYVSNRGHNSIAVYDIGPDGNLTLVNISTCGGNWPRNFALAPDGKFLLVANQYSNEVCVLPLLQGSATLGAPVARVTVTGASCIQFI
jgi:6-phosphogluconolactonase